MQDISLCETSECQIQYFRGEVCDHCNSQGSTLLTGGRARNISKFLCGVLRHFPEKVDIELTKDGWVNTETLTTALHANGFPDITETKLEAIVETDSKGRYELTDNCIRAVYGHSIDVELDKNDSEIPDILYHGTAPDNVSSIEETGLRPMSRQYVHLTDSISDAFSVGERHSSNPILFEVDSEQMVSFGYEITKRGKNVYTTESVPPCFVKKVKSSDK